MKEMEAASVAGVASLHNVPFMSIKVSLIRLGTLMANANGTCLYR